MPLRSHHIASGVAFWLVAALSVKNKFDGQFGILAAWASAVRSPGRDKTPKVATVKEPFAMERDPLIIRKLRFGTTNLSEIHLFRKNGRSQTMKKTYDTATLSGTPTKHNAKNMGSGFSCHGVKTCCHNTCKRGA